MKTLKPKTFVLLICAAFIAALLLLFTCLFLVQKVYDAKKIIVMDSVSREQKAEHIVKNDTLYDTYIVGGSKSGGYQPEYLNSITGSSAYNMISNGGCFYDYENYVRFLLDTSKNVKEIFLSVSSLEVSYFNHNEYVPSYMQTNVVSKAYYKIKSFQKKYLDIERFFLLIDFNNSKKKLWCYNKLGARADLDDYDYNVYEIQEDRIKWNQNVINNYGPFNDVLSDIFNLCPPDDLPACDQNINALKHIKQMCDDKNVKLTVVIGPTFITELHKYASPKFAKYLKDMVNVCPEGIWNFAGINDVSLNPYDFFDGSHFYTWVGTRILQVIYGKESVPNTSDMNSFGILLTPENIDSYLASQTERWQELKTEFEQTGTIKLQTKDDASYIGPDIKL